MNQVTQNCPSNVFSQECGCCRTEKSLVCSDHLVFISIGRINEEKMAAVKVYEETYCVGGTALADCSRCCLMQTCQPCLTWHLLFRFILGNHWYPTPVFFTAAYI